MAPLIRDTIAEVKEVRGVMYHVGRPDDGTDVTSFFNLEFNVPLLPMDKWRSGITRLQIQDELSKKFRERFPNVDFNFSQLIRDNVEEALSGVKGANSIKLRGDDLNVLEEKAKQILNILRTVKGVKNPGLFHILGQPNLEIQIDRKQCAALWNQRRRRRVGGRSGHRRPRLQPDVRRREDLRHRIAASLEL